MGNNWHSLVPSVRTHSARGHTILHVNIQDQIRQKSYYYMYTPLAYEFPRFEKKELISAPDQKSGHKKAKIRVRGAKRRGLSFTMILAPKRLSA